MFYLEKAAQVNPKNNTDHPIHIFGLHEKIQILIKWAKEQNIYGLSTIYGLAEHCGLQSRTSLNYYFRTSSLPKHVHDSVCDAYGFSSDWEEWRSSNLQRSTADQKQKTIAAELFKRRFYSSKLPQPIAVPVPAKTECSEIFERRFADFQFSIAGSYPSEQPDPAIPLILSTSFDSRGESIFIDSIRDFISVGLSSVDIQMIAPSGEGTIEAKGWECKSGEGNYVGILTGLPGHPCWRLTTKSQDDSFLKNNRIPNDGQDCTVSGFKPGDVISVKMTATILDCFVDTKARKLIYQTKNKGKFVEHLMKLGVLGRNSVTLATQNIEFKDDDRSK